jgi:hypothetical protein
MLEESLPMAAQSASGGWYYKRCTSDCLAQYDECVKAHEKAEEEKKKLDFPRMEQAVEWIREHKAELVLGTIVVVGGAAFVLTTGGSGALVLVPVSLAL